MPRLRQLHKFLTKYLWWSLGAKWRCRKCPTCQKYPSLRQAWEMSKPANPNWVDTRSYEQRVRDDSHLEGLVNDMLASLDRIGTRNP